MRENSRIAADASAPAAERAVALCWIFHLVGDMHQPLHAASLYSETFPDGDFYGTRFWVRQPHGGNAVSLHYLWDSAIQRSQNMPDVEKTAAHLLDAHPRRTLEELRERPFRGPASFDEWVHEESHRLAIAISYRDGRLAGATSKNDAPRLAEDYVAEVRTIAARRMAVAGYRLAEILTALLP